MSEIKVSRLRYIRGKKLSDIYILVERLGYKVEFKSLNKDGKFWIYSFNLPENKLLKDPGFIDLK